MCAKALVPDEEEAAEHREAQPEERVRVEGQKTERPAEGQQGQQAGREEPSLTEKLKETIGIGGERREGGMETKESELSGGEKAREQRGQPQRREEQRPKRRYLIHEIPSQSAHTQHSLQSSLSLAPI